MTLQQLHDEFTKLQTSYNELQCKDISDGIEIEGNIKFTAEYNNIPITDSYKTRIRVSTSFPNDLPKVWNLDNKVPRKYEHLLSEGTLCLGVSTEIRLKLRKNPSLVYFINEFVVNYLYSVSYWKKYTTMPFGERSHTDGILEFYKEHFNVDSEKQVLSILKTITDEHFQYRGHLPCPCNSGLAMRKCKHKDFLLNIFDPIEMALYKNDYQILKVTSFGGN